MGTFTLGGKVHRVGDLRCAGCDRDYPVSHDCSGLEHLTLTAEGENWFEFEIMCDTCGITIIPLGSEGEA